MIALSSISQHVTAQRPKLQVTDDLTGSSWVPTHRQIIGQGGEVKYFASSKMDEVGLLPARTKSKRTRSSNPSRDSHHGERASKGSPTSTSLTPRTSRPSLASRTSSAPLVPVNNHPKLLADDDDFDAYSHRDSVASIKDDPFFRNYQSPHSVSLARELRSATYSQQRVRDEELPEEPPPRSTKRPSADTSNSVNLPVRLPRPRSLREQIADQGVIIAPIEKRYGGYQYCNNWECGRGEEYIDPTGSWSTTSANLHCFESANVGR